MQYSIDEPSREWIVRLHRAEVSAPVVSPGSVDLPGKGVHPDPSPRSQHRGYGRPLVGRHVKPLDGVQGRTLVKSTWSIQSYYTFFSDLKSMIPFRVLSVACCKLSWTGKVHFFRMTAPVKWVNDRWLTITWERY